MIVVTKQDLERMYLTEHKTLAEIGRILGCTRQNVHYLLRKFSVGTAGAERFMVKCDGCGDEYSITRKRYAGSELHFCCKDCYTAYMKGEEYREWRFRQRIARVEFERVAGRRLRDGEVLRWVDGDMRNNAIGNLQVVNRYGRER